MSDYLDRLAQTTLDTIKSGYYQDHEYSIGKKPKSLKKSLKEAKGNPVIAEVKAASPSKGSMRKNLNPVKLAGSMIKGGAAGLSVLTEPKYFKGSIDYVFEINKEYSIPILMKDFVLSEVQIKTARTIGASAVLLIHTLFSRGYSDSSLNEMIRLSHKEGLEVLLETHTVKEFNSGLKTKADLIGVNNRDLKTLKTSLNITEKVLREARTPDRMVVSESGIYTAQDLRYLREHGAKAFLVGSAIVESSNPEAKVRELVEA
jgi:indole-3-glycerol phosphate synthase